MTELERLIYYLSDNFLIYPFIGIFLFSIFVTIKLRFIQIRTIPLMLKMLIWNKDVDNSDSNKEQVSPRTSLFIVLSTTIGMANIAGPIMAIGMGGPSALSGFIIASIFGAATTFLEVFLAVKYRKQQLDGSISGGPMEYLKDEFGPKLGLFYACATLLLLVSWSTNQANSLSVLLEPAGIPRIASGIVLAILVLLVLVGGVKRIGTINDYMVPFMFVLYCITTLTIIGMNYDKVGSAFSLIFTSFLNPKGVMGFASGYGLFQATRWGLARAVQTSEIGIGTTTFPHSASSASNPYRQGVLAMVSVYTNMLLSTLTSLTVLVSSEWLAPNAQFDITLFYKILENHFPGFGPQVLMLCGVLFAFGTILGNSYNASKCFIYLCGSSYVQVFYFICGITVIWGSITDVKLVWTIIDYFVLPVAIPHIIAIFTLTLSKKNLFAKHF